MFNLRDLVAATYERYGVLNARELSASRGMIDGLRAEEFDSSTINEAIAVATAMEAAIAAIEAVELDAGALGDLLARM